MVCQEDRETPREESTCVQRETGREQPAIGLSVSEASHLGYPHNNFFPPLKFLDHLHVHPDNINHHKMYVDTNVIVTLAYNQCKGPWPTWPDADYEYPLLAHCAAWRTPCSMCVFNSVLVTLCKSTYAHLCLCYQRKNNNEVKSSSRIATWASLTLKPY